MNDKTYQKQIAPLVKELCEALRPFAELAVSVEEDGVEPSEALQIARAVYLKAQLLGVA